MSVGHVADLRPVTAVVLAAGAERLLGARAKAMLRTVGVSWLERPIIALRSGGAENVCLWCWAPIVKNWSLLLRAAESSPWRIPSLNPA